MNVLFFLRFIYGGVRYPAVNVVYGLCGEVIRKSGLIPRSFAPRRLIRGWGLNRKDGGELIKLFYNGLVWSPGKTPVQAVSVEGNRIRVTGDNDKVLSLKKPGDELVNMESRLLIPGFSDSHVHMLMAGERDDHLSLHGVKSGEEILERARTYIANRCPKPGEWIVGVGFDHSAFMMPCMPDRRLADRISRSNPVILFRICYHAAVVNSAALARLDLRDVRKGVEYDEKKWEWGRIFNRCFYLFIFR